MEVVVLAVCTLVYLVTLILNALSFSQSATSIGYPSPLQEVWRSVQLHTAFTPASPVFLIWILIYVWNGAWIAYAWLFVCRPKRKRTMHELTFLFFTAALLFHSAWNYSWTNLLAPTSLGFAIVVLICLYLSLLTVVVPLYKNTEQMKLEQKFDLWATRVLTLNGLALFSTWIEVVLFINLASALKYNGQVSNEISSLVSLSLLLALFVLYFACEQTFLDRFGRHIVIDYLVYPWAVMWMLVEQSQSGLFVSDTVNHYTIVVMVVATVILVAKVALNVLYYFCRPIKYPLQIEEDLTKYDN